MTTEKKVASEAVPSTAPKTKATTRRTVRRTTTAKPQGRQARAATTAKKAVEEKATMPVKVSKAVKDKKKKADKKTKSGKVKMARDSFTMPKDEYAQFAILKARLLEMGQPAKKSELLRAGIKLLAGMTDLRLKRTMAEVPVIKTGRPKKKK